MGLASCASRRDALKELGKHDGAAAALYDELLSGHALRRWCVVMEAELLFLLGRQELAPCSSGAMAGAAEVPGCQEVEAPSTMLEMLSRA